MDSTIAEIAASSRLALIFKGLRRVESIARTAQKSVRSRLALIFKGFAALHAARLIIAYKYLIYINKLSVVKEKPSREWSSLEGL